MPAPLASDHKSIAELPQVVRHLFHTGQHLAATETIIEQLAVLDPVAEVFKLRTYREFSGRGGLAVSLAALLLHVPRCPTVALPRCLYCCPGSLPLLLPCVAALLLPCVAALLLPCVAALLLPCLAPVPPSLPHCLVVQGELTRWSMSHCSISALPESFGEVVCKGALNLNNNSLTHLPANFGSINVGGNLDLRDNFLESVPATFDMVTVGGHLCISRTHFAPGRCPLPSEFHNVGKSVQIWPRQ